MGNVLRMLLVDDNPADLGLAREALARPPKRSEITTLENGTEALKYLRKEGEYTERVRPDLVLLDLSLPGKDGLSILAAVKSNPDLRRIPIVIFSSSSLAKDIDRSYELGANAYVSKPGNLKDFFAAVKSIEEFWCAAITLPNHGE